jgi:small multidrug resistance pump
MAWLMLALTIGFEVTGSVMMKLSEGFANFWPSVGVFVFYGLALGGLTLVLKAIELSVAYAIWSGAGTALVAIIGIWVFGETLSLAKVVCLIMIIVGVVGLQLTA